MLKTFSKTTNNYFNYLVKLKENVGKLTPNQLANQLNVSSSLPSLSKKYGLISDTSDKYKWIGEEPTLSLAEKIRKTSCKNTLKCKKQRSSNEIKKIDNTQRNLLPLDKVINLVTLANKYNVSDVKSFVKELINN